MAHDKRDSSAGVVSGASLEITKTTKLTTVTDACCLWPDTKNVARIADRATATAYGAQAP